VTATPRLLEVSEALREAGLEFLIMGGHAVRHFGIDRNTIDVDVHVSADVIEDIEDRLRRSRLFADAGLRAGPSWRPEDFRRFQIGQLPNGREEWLEFWVRNHLLPPFPELYRRREEAVEQGQRLCYLSLPDLIRSKETERDDDWADVRLLEEILDARTVGSAAEPAVAISMLRSRRGFEHAEAAGLFRDRDAMRRAIGEASHPVTRAYLLPYVPDADARGLDPAADAALRRVVPGSSRHLAIVEAVRLAYQRAAKAVDRADKERRASGR
jgi:hypothetical protein